MTIVKIKYRYYLPLGLYFGFTAIDSEFSIIDSNIPVINKLKIKTENELIDVIHSIMTFFDSNIVYLADTNEVIFNYSLS